MNRNQWFLKEIEKSLVPSTGCTEPVAIALNAALAREAVKGTINKVIITLDPYLYKNAMGVGIPGCDGRGIQRCAAMGIICGEPKEGMNVLANVFPGAQEEAEKILDRVEVKILESRDSLFIQTEIITESDKVRVITLKEHTNIVEIKHAPYEPFQFSEEGLEVNDIQKYNLNDFLVFAGEISVEELGYLKKGLYMNRAIAESGKRNGLSGYMGMLEQKGYLNDSPVMLAHKMAGGGAYARMSGISMPVMTATGSGNQGLTLFLPIDAVAVKMGIGEEQELRAIALGALVNILAKSYIGALSSVCACGVASGIGASIGICYMLGAGEKEMLGAARNILGTVSGMICDGAKEECANKVALSSALAVEAAFLSLEGYSSSETSGILAGDLNSMFYNLGYLVHYGMLHANQAVIQIMLNKRLKE